MCGCSENVLMAGGAQKNANASNASDNKQTKKYWYDQAKALDIIGRSKMSKEQLVTEVRKKNKKRK